MEKEEKKKEGEGDGTYLRTWESAERLPDILVSLKGTVYVLSSDFRFCAERIMSESQRYPSKFCLNKNE